METLIIDFYRLILHKVMLEGKIHENNDKNADIKDIALAPLMITGFNIR